MNETVKAMTRESDEERRELTRLVNALEVVLDSAQALVGTTSGRAMRAELRALVGEANVSHTAARVQEYQRSIDAQRAVESFEILTGKI